MPDYRVAYKSDDVEVELLPWPIPSTEAQMALVVWGAYSALTALGRRGHVILFEDDMPISFYDLDDHLPFDAIVE